MYPRSVSALIVELAWGTDCYDVVAGDYGYLAGEPSSSSEAACC